MSTIRNETAVRDAWIRLILGVAFLFIGGFVVYLALEMVGLFGEGMGVDEASRKIYARAHIAVHIFGTASALAVGWFFLAKNRFLAILALFAILGCGGYGIVNMIGFTTTNRLSVAESKAAANSADWKSYDAQRAAIQGDIDWARKTVLNEENPREKRRLLARVDQKLKELEAVQPPRPSAATVLADPQATWFGRMTGSKAEDWQLALPVPVAVLMFTAEVLSFVFATYLIAWAVETLRSNRGSVSGGGGGGGNRWETEKPSTKPKATITPSVAAKGQPATNVVKLNVPASLSLEDRVSRYVIEQIARGKTVGSQLAVGHALGVSKPNVSKALKKLEAKGEVQRKRRGKFNEIVRPVIGGRKYASASI